MNRKGQRLTDITPITAGYEGKSARYSYDGRTLICRRSLSSRVWASITGAALAAGCSYGCLQLAREYSAQGLSGGGWLGAIVLPAIVLLSIYVVLWANLSDAKAVFDFTAGLLTIEYKGLRSLQSRVLPLNEIAAVRAGFRQGQTDAAEMQSTGWIIHYLTLTFQDGAEIRLFETTDERVVDATRDIIQKRLGLAVA